MFIINNINIGSWLLTQLKKNVNLIVSKYAILS